MISRSRESLVGAEDDDEYEDDDEEEEEEEWNDWEGTKSRPERWAPLGANDSDKEQQSFSCSPNEWYAQVRICIDIY